MVLFCHTSDKSYKDPINSLHRHRSPWQTSRSGTQEVAAAGPPGSKLTQSPVSKTGVFIKLRYNLLW